MKRFLCILLSFFSLLTINAQEFRCSVAINGQKLLQSTQQFETSDNKYFERMKTTLEDFINSRHWTNLEFQQNEKIDCSISIVLSERSTETNFKGQFSVQMRRPVYNSNYTTGLFNYVESPDIIFTYNENQALEFDPNTYTDNLTSVIAYYLYTMLGIYFDSFGQLGGDVFYEMAQNIAQAAVPSGMAGWKSSEAAKARYWFCENHINSAYQPLRIAYYNYHRLGLDMMTKNQPEARQNIIDALKMIQQVHKVRQNVLSVTQFLDVKMQEILSIFTPAPEDEKREVYFIIKEVSPINASKFKDWKIQ